MLPSLGFGLYLFVTTGQPTGLIFGGVSAAALAASILFGLQKEPVDLRAPVRFSDSRVAIGNRILPRWQRLWQPAWVTRVYEDINARNVEQQARLQLAKRLQGELAVVAPIEERGLAAWLGQAGSTDLILDLAGEGAHALIVGPSGAGKSELLRTWLVSLCQSHSPKKLRLQLVDFKGGAALAPFARSAWADGLVTDLNGDLPALLGWFNAELATREATLARLGASRIEDIGGPEAMPRVVLVVDELQAVLTDLTTHKALEAIAARGRSLGLHLIATAQSLAGIPRALQVNLGAKIAVGKTDAVDLAQLGYSRVASEGVSQAMLPEQSGHKMSTATLIAPARQVQFWFPSGGSIRPEIICPNMQKSDSEEYSPSVAQNGPPRGVFATESAVKLSNVFEFGRGFQKAL